LTANLLPGHVGLLTVDSRGREDADTKADLSSPMIIIAIADHRRIVPEHELTTHGETTQPRR